MRADETAAPGQAYPAEPEVHDAPARPGLARIGGPAFWGWAGPLLVTALGAFLRFNRLSVPKAVVFDETYYVGDAWAILKHGVELKHLQNADSLLAHGSTHILNGTRGELVAHPPLGKMMISVGEWLFGLTPFGWRFSVALVGSLAILMLARIVRRMTGSTLLGCVAGLLLALDGLELVLSRTAILDIFVMFWVLAAFGLLVIDRDRGRERLAAAAGTDGEPGSGDPDPRGPKLGIRWLRVAAGVCLGAAVASKWNGVWYIFAFGGLVLAWDLGARRAAGFPARLAGVLRSDAKWLPVSFGVVPAVVYIASWSGWFATPYGYDRTGIRFSPGGVHTSTIVAWLQYNKWMLQFGLGLTTGQTYKSNPLGWLLLARPISFYSSCLPAKGCGGPGSTEQEILAIGTPAIWWAAIGATLFCLVWWLMRRDWRAGAAVLGISAGWLPWIWFYLHDGRTEFYYYAVTFEPFLIIAITLCLGLIIGPSAAGAGRRALGAVIAGAYLITVLANFAYLYPILAGRVIPYTAWLSRMWFRSWI
ncbi:MAG TPA: phospholipid carrier-dependent glycosyltransferase [Streptosporangiaceae bacterium]|jgi:dolichyl-phosphate-mannose--protein O-mannosyl transferase